MMGMPTHGIIYPVPHWTPKVPPLSFTPKMNTYTNKSLYIYIYYFFISQFIIIIWLFFDRCIMVLFSFGHFNIYITEIP
jgi:hypothetical protein